MKSLATNEVVVQASGFHRDLNYLVISDIHLFHKNTPTDFIVSNLDVFFEQYSPTSAFAKLDAIFIAGDLFETLSLLGEEVVCAVGWFYRLFDFCSRHAIVLRELEGTPSHDAGQGKLLAALANRYKGKLDFKYINKLDIERIDSLGLSVLYVPDEWLGSTHKTQLAVEELMDNNAMTQVDIAIMHGLFSFQVPELKKPHLKYDEVFFLNKVRYFINIGHDHKPKTFDRIIVQGSFDRLRRGEEHPKGVCWCYLRQDGNHGYVLLENKLAKIYTTIQVRLKDLDKALEYVRKKVSTLPPNSFVEIQAKPGHPILQNIDLLKKEFVFLNFTKDQIDDDDKPVNKVAAVLQSPEYTPVNLNKDNIVDRVTEQVSHSSSLVQEDLSRLKAMLESLR